MNKIGQWFTQPVPLGRIAVLRTLAYLFVPVDIFLTANWVLQHKDLPTELYAPLLVGRLLQLPAPSTGIILSVCAALVAASVIAACGKAPRLLGWTVFFLYFEWMIIAMSYGKVDHDRFAYLVLLAVLPTLGAAQWGDKRPCPRAGWAVHLVQIAVICTYFFAAWAKLRFGGVEWLNGATLARTVIRRGTFLSEWTLNFPFFLVGFQWFIMTFELLSPIVLFIRNQRVKLSIIVGFYAFHIMTFGAITIIFLPHLVAMTAFLPLERLSPPRKWISQIRDAVRAKAAGEQPPHPRKPQDATSGGGNPAPPGAVHTQPSLREDGADSVR